MKTTEWGSRKALSRRNMAIVILICSVVLMSFLPSRAFAKKAAICSTASCTDLTGNQTAPMISVSPNGGLLHPEIAVIFWGDYWNSNHPSQYALVGMVQSVLNGAYLGGLAQYGRGGAQMGPGRMIPTGPVRAGTPSGGNSGVAAAINAAIGAGVIPGPNQYADTLYVVFIPPGTSGFGGGYNFGATCDSTCGSSFNGRSYAATWVTGFSSTFVQNEFSHTFTHELAEAASNAILTNCKSTVDGSVLNQVADVCNCPENDEIQLGGSYNAYWSQLDAACVIPEGWSPVYKYSGSGSSWSQIYNGTVRQIYAGGYGLVATNTSDNIMMYSGTGTTWTTIGLQGAMFAVGGGGANTIIDIAPDAGSIWLYSGSGTNWTQIDGPASAVYGGGRMLATDFSGSTYQYAGTGSNWTWIAATGDQMIVTAEGFAYAVGFDRNVWAYSGTPGSWSQIGSSAYELFAGFNSNIAMTQLAASKDVAIYEGGGTWDHQGGPGTTFAINNSAGNLFVLDSSRSTISKSNNIFVVNPAWTQVGVGAGRLISGGNSTFAVGPPVY
jgi:hypothetical protein